MIKVVKHGGVDPINFPKAFEEQEEYALMPLAILLRLYNSCATVAGISGSVAMSFENATNAKLIKDGEVLQENAEIKHHCWGVDMFDLCMRCELSTDLHDCLRPRLWLNEHFHDKVKV